MKYLNIIILVLVCLIIGKLGFDLYQAKSSLKTQIENAYQEGYHNGTYIVIKADEEIKNLKKENKELYDSIKSYKDKVSFLAQFHYQKIYITDTVYVSKPTTEKDSIITYEYENANKTDSLNYKLSIGSTREPNWYKLNISVSDKFTIINKKDGENNQTDIISGNNGIIDDVTVINTKKKYGFWRRFGIGPTFGLGYGLVNNKADIYVGFGLTYDLTKKK